jgi:parvulin-like peptidyl-prolyl isomerase
MKLLVLRIFAVGAGIVACASVAGCGDDEGLPDDVVAKVGDIAITKSDFERALSFATGRGNDPRDYDACVAAMREAAGDADGTQPPEAELLERCRAEWEQVKTNVMDTLIQAEWTRQEAKAQGIGLTDAQVERVFDQVVQGATFNKEALRRAGVSERQLFARVRQNQLHTKVREQLIEQARQVPPQDIADYYRRNKTDLIVPDRREMRIVLTRPRASAEAARAALDAGRSWKSVAREYSLHLSRLRGGRITATSRRESRVGLSAAIFRARKGELLGPVRHENTWAVFVVDRIKPSYQPTLEQASDEITKRLQSVRENQALEAYRKKYRDQTVCAPGFSVPACKNGPEQSEGQPNA